jgi:hypothetical protein
VLPTVVRATDRTQAPVMDNTSLTSFEDDTTRRWRAAKWSLPLYQFQAHLLVTDHRGALRIPTSSELELLMGFPEAYTLRAVTSSAAKSRPLATSRLKRALLARSWHPLMTAWFVQSALLRHGLVDDLAPLEELQLRLPRREPRVSAAENQKELSHNLVCHYLRHADHRGSDVRLDAGQLFRPSAWPRQPIEARLWVWRVVFSYGWKRAAHINELEARTALAALLWRLRKQGVVGQRYFHLMDSSVSLAVLTKKRSSSHQLNRVTKRYNAVELAASMNGFFGFVTSESNPADAPSRI